MPGKPAVEPNLRALRGTGHLQGRGRIAFPQLRRFDQCPLRGLPATGEGTAYGLRAAPGIHGELLVGMHEACAGGFVGRLGYADGAL